MATLKMVFDVYDSRGTYTEQGGLMGRIHWDPEQDTYIPSLDEWKGEPAADKKQAVQQLIEYYRRS